MLKKKITVKNKLGLHARAAVKFVNLANRFGSSVRIEKDGAEIDGKFSSGQGLSNHLNYFWQGRSSSAQGLGGPHQ
jgi:ribosome-associated toxin RatA of RatAB toxin-antitoxin module